MLGIRTQGGRMQGADESTELWRHLEPEHFGRNVQVHFSTWQLFIFIFCLRSDKTIFCIIYRIFAALFLKNGPTLVSFLFSVFSNKHHYNFCNKYMWKMSIQYMVPRFEPMTFGMWVSSHNHKTRAPAPTLVNFLFRLTPYPLSTEYFVMSSKWS